MGFAQPFLPFFIFDHLFVQLMGLPVLVGIILIFFDLFSVFIGILAIILSSHVFSSEKQTILCGDCKQFQDLHDVLHLGPYKRYLFSQGIEQ